MGLPAGGGLPAPAGQPRGAHQGTTILGRQVGRGGLLRQGTSILGRQVGQGGLLRQGTSVLKWQVGQAPPRGWLPNRYLRYPTHVVALLSDMGCRSVRLSVCLYVVLHNPSEPSRAVLHHFTSRERHLSDHVRGQ